MGIDADAYLAYGYDLGDLYEYVYERGEDNRPPWYDEEKIDDYGYEDVFLDFLLERAGTFTETDWQVEGYFERKYKAKADLGIEFHKNGGYEGTIFMFTHGYRAYWGGDKVLTQADLEVDPTWNDKLKWALAQLEIEIDEEPAWTLFTYLG